MTALAAVFAGIAVAGLTAIATGTMPSRSPSRRTRRKAVSRLQLWLRQSGVATTPTRFVAVCVGVGVAVAVFVAAVTGIAVVGLVLGVMATLVPCAYYGRRRAQRLQELQRAWPDGLRDLRASIASGHSLHQAIVALADGGPAPLRAALERYEALARILDVGPALDVIKAEVADPTTDRVLEVLILAEERGGRIVADVVDDLAEATARDIRVFEEIETDTLQYRLNAWAVFVLPWLVLLALVMTPGPFRDFYATTAGILVIGAGAVLSGFGIFIVRRLGKQPVEERVLVGDSSTVVSRGGVV